MRRNPIALYVRCKLLEARLATRTRILENARPEASRYQDWWRAGTHLIRGLQHDLAAAEDRADAAEAGLEEHLAAARRAAVVQPVRPVLPVVGGSDWRGRITVYEAADLPRDPATLPITPVVPLQQRRQAS